MEKQEDAKSSGGIWALVNIALSIAMVCVGNGYRGDEYCKFGAADFLYYGGILGLVMHGIGVLTQVAEWCAKRDGRISAGEKCGLGLLGCATFLVVIGEVIVLIWGSVVVFGNYADWVTEPLDAETYCHNTPMMFAFVLLVVRWVLMALIPVCICCCAPCLACLGISKLMGRDQEAV